MSKIRMYLPPLFAIAASFSLLFKLPGVPAFFGITCPACTASTPYFAMIGAAYFAFLTVFFLLFDLSATARRSGCFWSGGLLLSLTLANQDWCFPCLAANLFHLSAWCTVSIKKLDNTTPLPTKLALLFVAPIAALAFFSSLNFTFIVYGLTTESPFTALVKEGHQLPNFETHYLSLKDFNDSIGTIITFTAPSCPHCKVLLPQMDKIAAVHKQSGIRFINLTRALAEDMKLLSPNQEWIEDSKGSLYPYFGITGFPTVVFLDKNGTVQLSIAGAPEGTPEKIEKAIKNYLD